MDSRIKILDCTLRDGGFGLEDAAANGFSDQRFTPNTIDKLISHLRASKLDIIELGAVEQTAQDKRCYAIYPNIESISLSIPKDRTSGQMYAALFRGPDIPIKEIPDWNPSYCEGVRVIIRYSELQKSLDFCSSLAEKGYQVFVQPMLTTRYSEDELQLLIDSANAMDAFALYFVDSYGYMQAKDIERFFKRYDEGLKPTIRVGFHAHNNMNLAFANALTFLSIPSQRNIIVDACALGLGQGAGNLQTEIIADHMNRYFETAYDYPSILEVREVIDTYSTHNIWGYSVTHFLPAIHNTAYKYAVALRKRYGLSFVQIDSILKNMPNALRFRYTKEDVEKLIMDANISEV